MRNTKGMAKGLIAGAVAGTALGMSAMFLLKPKNSIRKTASNTMNTIGNMMQDVADIIK